MIRPSPACENSPLPHNALTCPTVQRQAQPYLVTFTAERPSVGVDSNLV
jgi:hypothetical protein